MYDYNEYESVETERKQEDLENTGAVLSKYRSKFVLLGIIMLVYASIFILRALGVLSLAVCNWIMIPFTAFLLLAYFVRRKS